MSTEQSVKERDMKEVRERFEALPSEVQRDLMIEATELYNGGYKYVLLRRCGKRIRAEGLGLKNAITTPRAT